MSKTIIPIAIAILVVAGFYFTNVEHTSEVNSEVISITKDGATKAAFPDNSAYDSLPHYRYKQITDSIRFAAHQSDPFAYGSTTSMGSIGIYAAAQDTTKPAYALTLSNVHKKDDALYFIYNHAPHIAWVKWDSTTGTGNTETRYGHYESKPLQVGYNAAEKRLFIPVNKTTYIIVTILMWLQLFIALAVFLTVFISYPITIFLSIARGKGFNETNGVRFKRMGYVLAAFAVLGFLVPLIISFAFSNMIPSQLYLPVWECFTSIIPALVLAIALWLLGKAFSQGSRLQEFENTTI